ncbi:MAG: YggS family pyridoxal phosphate-dependent enzyme [Gemmataceae bacterium]
MSTLADNLKRIEERIAAACARAGRPRGDVTLVAVTKTVGVEVARQLPGLGVVDLGESRPQELWKKAEAIPGVRWHLIGHLQRNKIERTVPLVTRVHSIDSVRVLDALEAAGRPVEGLLEFNCSGEASKGGFAPDEADAVAGRLAGLKGVRVTGLMTMAAADDEAAARRAFGTLRGLRDRLGLRELSMGMSGDFEAAIEEGATLIRLGSVLFEGVG